MNSDSIRMYYEINIYFNSNNVRNVRGRDKLHSKVNNRQISDCYKFQSNLITIGNIVRSRKRIKILK